MTKMTDKTVKLFECECACKIAIINALSQSDVDTDDYTEVLTKVKKWIDWIITDDEDEE